MTSASRGEDTSVEVLNISQHGFWLMVDDVEYFLPYEKFPWFQKGTVEQICDVKLERAEHLH